MLLDLYDRFQDLNLEPTSKVGGRVVLTDGQPIPARSQITLSLKDLLDAQRFALGEDGSFHFAGVPAESVTLYLRIPGYEFSPGDRLLKFGSATNITVVTNLTGLVIGMKPQTRR